MSLFRNLESRSRKQPRRQLERGQSLLEFCFGGVIIAFLAAGLVDLGRAYYSFVALEDAAGEAAIYMSIHPSCPYDALVGGLPKSDDGVANGCDPAQNAMWRAENSGGKGGASSMIDWTNSATTKFIFTCTDNNNAALAGGCPAAQVKNQAASNQPDKVRVDIEYKFTLLAPWIPSINGTPTLTLHANATQLVTVND